MQKDFACFRSRRPPRTGQPTSWRGWCRSVTALAFAAGSALAIPGHVLSAQGTQTVDLPVSATVVANCTIEAPPLAFGNFDPIANATVTRSIDITLTCTQGSSANVTMDNGGNFDGTTRRMGGAASRFLKYELYKDASYATRWGSDTITVFAAGTNKATVKVYGRIPNNQTDVVVGPYTDTVKVTVNF